MVVLVAALLTSQAVASHRAHQAKAQAKARTVARCQQIDKKALEYVNPSGVSAGGKEWAQNTLAAWPADLKCSSTQDFLKEMASGALDARLSRQANPTAAAPDAADCERRIAALMDLDIDEQSRRDNVDAVRIECDMPPLQQDPFWQEAWQRHQRGQ
jgi:hypothetical protein